MTQADICFCNLTNGNVMSTGNSNVSQYWINDTSTYLVDKSACETQLAILQNRHIHQMPLFKSKSRFVNSQFSITVIGSVNYGMHGCEQIPDLLVFDLTDRAQETDRSQPV